ncbi:MAG: serine/threonine-protein phosphatase [Candidatus Eisenbacteria bacterium]|nr:serine/threonine-protein phosphatase [Candidatus Eisenbacteria bacterium]
MARKKPARTRGPLADLLRMVLMVPLVSLPFAGFFVIVSGSPFAAFGGFYAVSFVFTILEMLASWTTKHFLQPGILANARSATRGTITLSATYMGLAILAAIAAALILNYTFVPGFLSGIRSLITVLVYCLLFGTLMLGVSLAVMFHREAMEKSGADRELLLARRIQRSFLLSEFPQRSRIEVHAVNVSSKQVSGDFYDVVPVGEEHVVLAIADVSGKGVPAALLSSMLQASVRTQAGVVESPAAMMRRLNELACQRVSTGQFATFFLAVVDEPTLGFRFTNAGHNFPVLQRARGERELLERGGCVVGMLDGPVYEEEALTLAPGDRIVFYTDGVTEAEREDGEMLGEERLYALLDAAPRELSAEQLVEHVLAGVRAWLDGVEPGDDITVMVLRVLERPVSRG